MLTSVTFGSQLFYVLTYCEALRKSKIKVKGDSDIIRGEQILGSRHS